MNKATLVSRITTALDVLCALSVLLVICFGFFGSFVYHFGFGVFETCFDVLMIALPVRFLLLFPWKNTGHFSIRQSIRWVAIGLLMLLSVPALLHNTFNSSLQVSIFDRSAFADASDDVIQQVVVDNNLWYPHRSLIKQILEEVPETDGIAYFGDQRGYVFTYLIYPRRLYIIPQLQFELNRRVEDKWEWMEYSDPFQPRVEPKVAVLEPWNTTTPDPEIQASFLQMLELKDIQWILYYNSLSPEKTWLRRIPE